MYEWLEHRFSERSYVAVMKGVELDTGEMIVDGMLKVLEQQNEKQENKGRVRSLTPKIGDVTDEMLHVNTQYYTPELLVLARIAPASRRKEVLKRTLANNSYHHLQSQIIQRLSIITG